jgi:4-azaleucine resistance transporter AzlC
MTRAAHRRAFFDGMRDATPFLIVLVPFGALFGVVAREAGWNMAEILGMSVMVIAGASQFTALQLMEENAPVLIVILTAMAVNLRHAMYSASLAPHLGAASVWRRALIAYGIVDQTYAQGIDRYARAPARPPAEKAAYFFGLMATTYPIWYAASVAGALMGATVPAGLALDFAVPITFIALVAPALQTLPQVAAAFVATVASLALAGLPFSFGVLIAAALAMIVGASLEAWLERRA